MISVIVCTYNRAGYLVRLMESIASNNLDKNLYEVVVVDNNSTDDTENVCQNFSTAHPDISFRYCNEKEQGISAARNRGIVEAEGDFVLFVDDDAFVEPDFLSSYLDYFGEHPDVMALGGPIEPYYETCEPPWMTPYTRTLLTAWINLGDKPRTYPRGRYPSGGNAAYRKEIFEKVGCFNTKLGRKGNLLLGSEEKDIFDKMKDLNMPFIYIPEPVLHHCIPQMKLEDDYFNRLTIQIGKSERLRTLAHGKSRYFRRMISELVKWMETIVLYAIYCLLGQHKKGWKLILFRKNVTKGLSGSE